jgi:hypothetical protein
VSPTSICNISPLFGSGLICRLYVLSASPDVLDRSSSSLEYCSNVQYNNGITCGVYKPLSGLLSACPSLVDRTRSNAWGPPRCPARHAPTLRRLLP